MSIKNDTYSRNTLKKLGLVHIHYHQKELMCTECQAIFFIGEKTNLLFQRYTCPNKCNLALIKRLGGW